MRSAQTPRRARHCPVKSRERCLAYNAISEGIRRGQVAGTLVRIRQVVPVQIVWFSESESR